MVIRHDPSLVVSFKSRSPQVGDMLRHIASNSIVKIFDVDEKYGWFKVKFPNGVIRKFTSTGGSSTLFKYLTPEEFADYRLSLANMDSNDSWRE